MTHSPEGRSSAQARPRTFSSQKAGVILYMPNPAVAREAQNPPPQKPAPLRPKAPLHIVTQLLNRMPQRAVICDDTLCRVQYANTTAMRWGLSQLVGLQLVACPLLMMDERLRQHTQREPQDLPLRFIGRIARRWAVIHIHVLYDDKGTPSQRLLLW